MPLSGECVLTMLSVWSSIQNLLLNECCASCPLDKVISHIVLTSVVEWLLPLDHERACDISKQASDTLFVGDACVACKEHDKRRGKKT